MEFIQLVISQSRRYSYNDASNEEMAVLGHFLATDVSCDSSSFKDWLFAEDCEAACSNLTALEKDNGDILLSDLYSEDEHPKQLRMSRQQFLQILDDWQEKVYKSKPKEVTIKYENDQFTIETSD